MASLYVTRDNVLLNLDQIVGAEFVPPKSGIAGVGSQEAHLEITTSDGSVWESDGGIAEDLWRAITTGARQV
jgi:hypothetical protein